MMVTEPTREDKILDLFLTSNPTLVNNVMTNPGISNHDGIPMIDMVTSPKLLKSKPRKVYKYQKANNEGLTKDFINLSSKISASNSSTVDEDWKLFKEGIFQAMDTHIASNYSSKK